MNVQQLQETLVHPSEMMRMGAICVLRHEESHQVLVGKRVREPVGTWQFPQGGLKAGQGPVEAALEELREETGICLSPEGKCVLDRAFAYRFDRPTQKHGWGQCHFVVYGDYLGPAQLDDPEDDEFSDLAWMNFAEVIRRTAYFRQQQYEEIYRTLVERGVELA